MKNATSNKIFVFLMIVLLLVSGIPSVFVSAADSWSKANMPTYSKVLFENG